MTLKFNVFFIVSFSILSWGALAAGTQSDRVGIVGLDFAAIWRAQDFARGVIPLFDPQTRAWIASVPAVQDGGAPCFENCGLGCSAIHSMPPRIVWCRSTGSTACVRRQRPD